jgi:hypothetical protein
VVILGIVFVVLESVNFNLFGDNGHAYNFLCLSFFMLKVTFVCQ